MTRSLFLRVQAVGIIIFGVQLQNTPAGVWVSVFPPVSNLLPRDVN